VQGGGGMDLIDSTGLDPPVRKMKPSESDAADDPVIVYSRWSCVRCWVCRWHLWSAGVDYEIRSINADREE
jgi:hypothetical protein